MSDNKDKVELRVIDTDEMAANARNAGGASSASDDVAKARPASAKDREPAAEALKDSRAERVRRILEASSLSSPSHDGPSQAAAVNLRRAYVRPENEDDDGYDPYSDRPATSQTWESDPWR